MFIKKLLIALILLAIVTRFIRLDYAPPHLSNDEIGAAYAAYSISRTMRDGNNQFLPILWTSHAGYGSPLAVYLPLVSIVFLGNSDFAVRLPSAVLGSLTIIFIGLLVMELTRNNKLAIITSFLLAFSPWHFSASRWALESNYGLFFLVLGIYLFFLGLKNNKNWVTIISFISFSLSVYSYYTEWVLTPLIIISLLVFYRKKVFKKKIYYLAIALFGILSAPIFFDFFRHLSSSRAVSEFIINDINVGRLLSGNPGFFEKGQIILKAILDKFSSYFSLDYLFFYGAKLLPNENPYQFGFFLSPFLIAFVLGLFVLKTYFKNNSGFIYFLLIASPLAASITEGDINNWRSLPQLLPVALVTAVGTLNIWGYIKDSLWMKILGLGLLAVSLLYFVLVYSFHFPIEKAEGYQYGYKQLALYINQNYEKYEKIIIDPRFGNKDYYYIGVPSSYIPFYTYLSPVKVQNAKYFLGGTAFDKYEFRDIDWANEKVQKNYLYSVPYDIVPALGSGLKLVYEIQLPNWRPVFKLYSLME